MRRTGGPGREGPGESPFGPLELPRDETQMLPSYEEWDEPPPPPPAPESEARTVMFTAPPLPPAAAPPTVAPTGAGPAGPQATGPVAYPAGLFRPDPAGGQGPPAHYGLPQAPLPPPPPRGPAPRRPSRGVPPAVMAGIAGGAVVVATIVVLLATGIVGGGDEPASAAAAPSASGSATASPEETEEETAPSARPSASAAPSASPAARQLDAVFQVAAGSRTVVAQAVSRIQKCEDVSGAVRDLNAAAEQRDKQLSQLGGVDASSLTNGAQLVAKLREAWTASAEADRKLAAWGEQVDDDCDKGKAKVTDRKREADRASARATRAKNDAVRLWNPIARQSGLPVRTAGEI